MLMNLSVYILGFLIFAQSIRMIEWHLVLLFCSVSVGVGILLFDQNVYGYVGLSGALYGMTVFGLLRNIKHNTLVYFVVYVFVCYKVLAQQSASFDPSEMAAFIGGNVIASAHLMGLIAGNLGALIGFVLANKKSDHDAGMSETERGSESE
jgi:rhomboid family GlyGly-CTERM serine protease